MDTNELVQYLKKTAARRTLVDEGDFDIHGSSGGQTDDAYYLGSNDGEINYARELLAKFFPDA